MFYRMGITSTLSVSFLCVLVLFSFILFLSFIVFLIDHSQVCKVSTFDGFEADMILREDENGTVARNLTV
jgi:hypothetical protein